MTDSIEVKLQEYALLGSALIAAQRVEFYIYALAAHIDTEHPSKDGTRFSELTAESYLRGDPATHKATLGQLVKKFAEILDINTVELEQFVEDRNQVIHNYWRLYQSQIRDSVRGENGPQFLREFIELSNIVEKQILGCIKSFLFFLAKKYDRLDELPFDPQFDVEMTQHRVRILKNMSGSEDSEV